MRNWTGWIGSAIVAAALSLTAYSQAALAEGDQIELGYMRCDVEGGVSFIVGSTRDIECIFESTDRNVTQLFDGEIKRYGIDIGFIKSGVMLWAVIGAIKFDLSESALAGDYLQVSAEASVGLGLGANVLLGGNGIKLVPVSISGFEGLNVAAGVGTMTLTPKT